MTSYTIKVVIEMKEGEELTKEQLFELQLHMEADVETSHEEVIESVVAYRD